MSQRFRIKVLGDPKWVLGYIARETADRINADSKLVQLSVLPAPKDISELREIERDCDVLHFLNPWEFKKTCWASFKPLVVTYHHVVEESWSLFDDYYRRADAICAVTESWRNTYETRRVDKSASIFLTYYGIDGDLFRPLAHANSNIKRRFDLPADSIVLGFAASKSSNFLNRKGPDRYFSLIRALQHSCGNRIRLVMFGEGWTSEDVPTDIRGSVTIPGYLPYEDLPALYAGLDFYICLSTCEGGPYPVLESMACGVKVISTPVGCVPDLIHDGENGFCVGHEDFLDRIPAIISRWTNGVDESVYLGQIARKSVLQRHTWNNVVGTANFENIYLSAMRNWRSKSTASKLKPILDHNVTRFCAKTKAYVKLPLRYFRSVWHS